MSGDEASVPAGDLVAKSENLCVARVAGHQQQAEARDQEPKQLREN